MLASSYERIGISMQQRRVDLGFSLTTAATQVGITGQYWKYIEDGARQVPSLQAMGTVANALGVAADDALASRMLREQMFWNLSAEQSSFAGENVGRRIMERVLPEMDDTFTSKVIDRNYPVADPSRRTNIKAPASMDLSTWPRPVLVDAMCASIDTVHLGPNGMECTLVGGKTVSINLSGHKEKELQDSPPTVFPAVTPPTPPTTTPSVVTPPVATVSSRQGDALADFDAARKLVRESRSGARTELNPDMVNKQSLKM